MYISIHIYRCSERLLKRMRGYMTYHSVKRDLLQCQKRPTTVSKETYLKRMRGYMWTYIFSYNIYINIGTASVFRKGCEDTGTYVCMSDVDLCMYVHTHTHTQTHTHTRTQTHARTHTHTHT